MKWPFRTALHNILSALAIGFAVCALAGASLITSAPSRSSSADNLRRVQTGDVALQTLVKDQDLPLPLRSLLGPGHWLNTTSLRAEDLRGKVVLVNFWTYSCINSLRPLPYLRAGAEKYRDRGLVVVGVHTPEFEFEHDAAKVQRMLSDLPV
jgi:thiol-disulfide isomerase/thioredoxin